MIEMGKTYRTRDNREVRIYRNDGGGNFPVHGAILPGAVWQTRVWTASGGGAFSGVVTDIDLIEVIPNPETAMSNEKQEGATPGPWTLDPGVVMGSRRVKAGGRLVAEVSAWGHGDVDQAAANARLISAAPDMLATLREIESVARLTVTADHTHCVMAINMITDRARAAIGAAVKKG